jgi:hypothetical protein
MPDDQYYLRIKEKAAPGLFKIPQVRAVGLGPKFVGGRPVGRLAIQVYVKSKLPQSSLKAEEIIPEFIDDVPTDVLIWARTASIQGPKVDDCRVGVIQGAKEILTGPTPTDMELTSASHGLFDRAVIRITGDGSITNIPYRVTVKDPDTFIVPIIENGRDKRPVNIPYVANSARWINVSNFDNLCCSPSGPIESISPAGKVKIRSTAHGLVKGDRVKISKARLPLEPAIHKIERNDNDNFTLVGANPSDFSGTPTGWRWLKVGMAPAGPITAVSRGNPVVISAPGHGLAEKDKVIIITNDGVTIANLDNLIRRDIGPYEIKPLNPDSFSIPGVDATGWGPPTNDFAGAWIKVIDDRKNYGRKWGGIRLEVKGPEKETVEKTSTNNNASSPLATTVRPSGERVRVETKLGTGTLGCIAIDNFSGKKVLLSNAHVLNNGTTDDFTVHHPTHYQSSKSCSNNIIAEKIRMVHGEDAVHHFTLDAAIAKFDPDEGKYDPFIVDIGPVKGVAPIAASEIINADYRVWKRGAQTGITEGLVISTNFGFTSTQDGRIYRNQLHVHPVSGAFRGFINIQGDSGSVLVNKDNRVVGLIHSATDVGGGIANPINEVELGLNIKIWTEADLVTAGEEPIDPTKQTSEVVLPDLFANTVAELSATEAGNNLAVIVNSHVVEVMHMIEANKKFATLWHRNHGPEVMKRMREAIAARNERVPVLIQGQSLQEIGINILGALKRFGSPELSEHVEEYQQLVLRFLNMTYEDFLELLQRNPQLFPKT